MVNVWGGERLGGERLTIDLFEDENAEMTHLGSGLFHDKDEQ